MPGGKIAIPKLGSVHPESVQELTAVQELRGRSGTGTAGFIAVPESHLPGQMWREMMTCVLHCHWKAQSSARISGQDER